MPWYQLRTDSVAAFAEFILSVVILLYLLSIKRKSTDALLITAYMSLTTLFFCLYFLRATSAPGVRIDRIHDLTGGVVAMYHLWFSYKYKFNAYSKELRTVIIIFFTLLIVAFGLHFRVIQPTFEFLEARLYYILFFFSYFWSMFVFLRKAEDPRNSTKEEKITIEHNSNTQLSRDRQALRSFAQWSSLFTLNYLLASIVLIGGKYFGFSAPVFWTSLAISHILSMLSLIWFAILYISYAEEKTSFQAKLVGLIVFTVLLLIGSLGFILLGTGYIPKSEAGQAINKAVSILMVSVPVITVLIVVIFPYLLKNYLLRPLSVILSGVHRINSGDLNVQVPTLVNDEIGYLSSSFNQMTRSLQEYANEMENKVAERTRVIEVKSNELEKQKQILEVALTNLKATQAQLIQSEKLASLGQLTAGIAHEIQNPLNFVNNFSETNIELINEMQQEIDKGNLNEIKFIANDVKENEQKILHHGKRADTIVKNMLQHSKLSTGGKEEVDLNALIDECLRLSYHRYRAKDKSFDAKLERQLNPIIKVMAVPQDISRVLINLFNNALYSVNEKKKQINGAYEPILCVSTKQINEQVEVRVKDNGFGIPQNIIDKIYQPFFTTKPTGEGTGLGLSMSYDIIKSHGGELKVESIEGEGAEFKIQLPYT